MGKESACIAGDAGNVDLIPGSGRSSGGGHGNPLQYSCLENPMDRGAWKPAVHGSAQSRTRLKQLSAHTPKQISGDRVSGGRAVAWCLIRCGIKSRSGDG